MDERLEEKYLLAYNLVPKIFLFFALYMPLHIIVYGFQENKYLGFFLMILIGILWFCPILVFFGYAFSSTPHRVILERDLFIVKMTLFKKIIIPVKNISGIKKTPDSKGASDIYIIYYDNEELWLYSGNYRFFGYGFEKFIGELQKRVDKAKEGLEEDSEIEPIEVEEKVFTKYDLNPKD